MFELIVPAFISGFLMFLAPCTLPLIPGFLGFLFAKKDPFWKRLSRVGLFLLGFSLVFILFAVFGAGIVRLFGAGFREMIARLSGGIIMIFGLMMIFSTGGFGWMQKFSLRFPKLLKPGGSLSSFLLGLTFATGWTPCIGPVLGTVLTLGLNSRTRGQGLFLIGWFIRGFAIPFALFAVFQSWFERRLKIPERFEVWFRYVAGGILIVIGIAFMLEQMGPLVQAVFEILKPIQYRNIENFL
jgi:cytochrome c-type biogenesis protein